MEEMKDVDQPQPRVLNVGDTYRLLGENMTIAQRTGDVVLAENDKYIEVFKVQHRKAKLFPNGATGQAGEYPIPTSEWNLKHCGHWHIKSHQKSKQRKEAQRHFEQLCWRQTRKPPPTDTPRTLQVGDWYEYEGQKMEIVERKGQMVMAFNPSHGWEVFKIRKHESYIWPDGTTQPAGEYPPSSNEWGDQAGCYMPQSEHLARKCFNKLTSCV